jgi:hypothetical protein
VVLGVPSPGATPTTLPERNTMGKILAKTIRIWDFDAGKRVQLDAGTELPEWAEERVTNPKLFVKESQDTSEESFDENDDDLESLTVPKLKELADEEGVDLGEATKKAEIIEAIRNHRGSDD